MVNSERVLCRDTTITNELGLHARTAGKISKLAQRAGSKIWLIKGDEKADAASIIDMVSLYCPKGTKIRLVLDDEADMAIFNEIIALIEKGFGE